MTPSGDPGAVSAVCALCGARPAPGRKACEFCGEPSAAAGAALPGGDAIASQHGISLDRIVQVETVRRIAELNLRIGTAIARRDLLALRRAASRLVIVLDAAGVRAEDGSDEEVVPREHLLNMTRAMDLLRKESRALAKVAESEKARSERLALELAETRRGREIGLLLSDDFGPGGSTLRDALARVAATARSILQDVESPRPGARERVAAGLREIHREASSAAAPAGKEEGA
jgi:hypothetical protein